MNRLLPRSLLGQMLLAVALALLAAQALSAVLLFRADEARRESGAMNGLAFQLVADPRFDYRQPNARFPLDEAKRQWRRLRVERTSANPLLPGEEREPRREDMLRAILVEQGITPAEVIVTTRHMQSDHYVRGRLKDRGFDRLPDWAHGDMILAALRREGEAGYSVARIPVSEREPRRIGALMLQTLLTYALLVGLLAFLMRRMTRPLGALTRRLEQFGQSRDISGQLEPSGPEDTRRLILAHNAMEDRIVALLDEKDVMLGAIGHDLKTPLAALRVRIESVEDDNERRKMAAGIEDITRSLDDILSLARVGRPSDPLERTDLAALLESVVEEFEDMGDPVSLGETQRTGMRLRATWLRRALRNLISNALRYGGVARVSMSREGQMVAIRIEDDGPGIPENEIGAMMEPFARGETSRNRETGGAGLGLTLARAIAEQHGGAIVLKNRRGDDGTVQGLIAELRLPID